MPIENQESTINQRLKILIDALNLNPRSFSKRAGVAEGTTRSYIDRGSKPSSEYIAAIATSIAELNLRWLLTGEGMMFIAAAEPASSNQKNSGGNNIGQNTGSGQVTQTHSAGTTGQAASDDCAQKLEAANNTITLLQQQVKDKERIIQLLERHSMPPN